jgi:hypothetical protein
MSFLSSASNFCRALRFCRRLSRAAAQDLVGGRVGVERDVEARVVALAECQKAKRSSSRPTTSPKRSASYLRGRITFCEGRPGQIFLHQLVRRAWPTARADTLPLRAARARCRLRARRRARCFCVFAFAGCFAEDAVAPSNPAFSDERLLRKRGLGGCVASGNLRSRLDLEAKCLAG